MNPPELSQYIRRVRTAQKSGFGKGFIPLTENFRTTPSRKELEKTVSAPGIGLGDLFCGDASGETISFSRVDGGAELQRSDSRRPPALPLRPVLASGRSSAKAMTACSERSGSEADGK